MGQINALRALHSYSVTHTKDRQCHTPKRTVFRLIPPPIPAVPTTELYKMSMVPTETVYGTIQSLVPATELEAVQQEMGQYWWGDGEGGGGLSDQWPLRCTFGHGLLVVLILS